MSLSQMQVFNQYIMPATLETLDQYLAAFNAASRGAIVLSPTASLATSSKSRSSRPWLLLSAAWTAIAPTPPLLQPT